jgi:ABC-type Fe3+ transport system permease subunit
MMFFAVKRNRITIFAHRAETGEPTGRRAGGKASGPTDRAAVPSSRFVFAFALAHQRREQGAANAALTEYAASDEEPQHPALSLLAIAAFILAFAFVVVFLLAALAQEMGEENAADATAAQDPAGDQKPQDLAMIFVLGLILVAAFVLVFVLVSLLPALAQEMRKKQAADAPTTEQPARNQEFQDAMLLIASLLALCAGFVAFLLATAFTQQASEKQAPRAPAARDAASNHKFFEFQILHDFLSFLLRPKPWEQRGPVSAPSGIHSRSPRSH